MAKTTTVIDWFKLHPQKSKSIFIKIDIAEFYPSISEELLNCSISFARSISTISDSVINGIHHSRKSLLFHKTSIWVKNGNNSLFYITQGSYDGAEIFELVWFYLLNRLSTVIDKSSDGLYRDDWIAAIKQMVQSFTELGKILLDYSRNKDFQSPSKKILSKQIF